MKVTIIRPLSLSLSVDLHHQHSQTNPCVGLFVDYNSSYNILRSVNLPKRWQPCPT